MCDPACSCPRLGAAPLALAAKLREPATRRCLVPSRSVGTCGASERANRSSSAAAPVCAQRIGQWAGALPLPPQGFDPRGGPEGGPLRGPKKCPPDPPCGAKPRGGGGAPPTGLILLRNQLPSESPRAAAAAASPTAPAPPLRGPRGASDTATPSTRPRPPRRSASPSRGVRLCLAGRQALTCLRPCSASSDTPASARCALTGTPDTFARRGPSARALRPCGRNGSNAAAWHPRVLSGREGLVPRLVRMLRIRFVRPLELSRCIARLNSRARAMTFQ